MAGKTGGACQFPSKTSNYQRKSPLKSPSTLLTKDGGRARMAAARKKPCWVAPDGGADHFTALPLELRAHIAASLPFWQVVQLSVLSRPWRHIHHHAPVVKIHLDDYAFDLDPSLPGAVDEGAILGLRVALGRRAQDGVASKVDALFLRDYPVATGAGGGYHMPRHAARIIALADARWIRVSVAHAGLNPAPVSWTLDLTAAARHLQVFGEYHLAPAIAGPGGAALLELFLTQVSLCEWPPCLPSLRSLTLDDITVEAAFAPAAAWCPLLEHLGVFSTRIEQARVGIRLPLLKSLEMEDVDVRPHNDFLEPFGEVAIDAPELEELELRSTTGTTAVYRSLTLRAPRLRHLGYHNQFVAGGVDIDVGRPGSVRSGSISFESNAEIMCPKMRLCRMQMMRMLEGLLPELSPEDVANAARPHMKLDKYSVEGFEIGEMIPEEKLTCDLSAVMSSLKV
ncbi:unnamed protein product [Urochloa decumbens]|uniref:F-box/LRR-repeat protein 15/At3g58940/PEG3-like LRR domain-containing protein n=1 Tax=Urochloa decumbens TaxID=240449 RepID=A0ABC9FJD8_9POAL